MCGVFGYVGAETDVGSVVLTALRTLEYRGYDSWGIAIAAGGALHVAKDVGRINGRRHGFPRSTVGLGHTRWATHGGVSVANAHPHLDCNGRLAVVHNGIIENHVELRRELLGRGHVLRSETDSEVVAHLVEERLCAGSELDGAVADVLARLDGYNAIVVLDRDRAAIAAAKTVSPLVVGQGISGFTIASDPLALQPHADRLIYLEDDHLAVVTVNGVEVKTRSTRKTVSPPAVPMREATRESGCGGHPDFFTKEVSEQPDALRRIVAESRQEISALAAAAVEADRIVLVGCGTAGHAALAGSYFLSEICRRDVAMVPASEFRYRTGFLDQRTLVVALSQSGETVDVLDAVFHARSRGARLAAIVNRANSTLHRSIDICVLLRAGVEQCVLATKSYTAKLATLLLTAHAMNGEWEAGAEAVLAAASVLEESLTDSTRDHVRAVAERFSSADHLYVVGRGVHYPSALEAALKIKEASYLHAEGFPGGELKHGVIALVSDGVPCLVFAPSDETRVDALSGAMELKSRGGYMIGIGTRPDAVFDEFFHVGDAGPATPIVEALPGQLLGYYSAVVRGHDPDRPRNLAKSVTVK